MESINDKTPLYVFLVGIIIIKSSLVNRILTISELCGSLEIMKKQRTRSGTNEGIIVL